MRDGRLRIATVVTRLEGGAGVLALRGARSLDPERFEVTIIAGRGERLFDAARNAGLNTVVAPRLKARIEPGHDVAAYRALRSLFAEEEFDVVHTHCAKAGALGRLAAHHAGVPRIVHTYHGFPFHEFQQPLRRRAYVEVERRLGTITDRTLCVGTGVAVEAVRRGVASPERVRTIGAAVDLDAPTRTPSTRARARRLLGLPSDAVVVGAVGRLTYQKAPEDFATAVRSLNLPDVVGVWVGGSEPGDSESGRWASDGTIRFVGERTDVLDVLPGFDVFVLPSRYEGLPLAIIEAMVCGIPVLATAVNAVADAVVPGRTGILVPPQRPDLLADALRHLLESPEATARMTAEARGHVRERYGMDSLAEVLAVAYSEG